MPYYNIAFFYDYLRDDHHWTQQMVTLAGYGQLDLTTPRLLAARGLGVVA